MVPPCHQATCTLDGLIEENDRAMDPAPLEPSDQIVLEGRAGVLILDSIGEGYLQDSPLDPSRAAQCLATVAKLHAAAWEDVDILKSSQERLSLGSYHLTMRNPNELANMEKSWDHFRKQFHSKAPDLFDRESIKKLGQRVKDMALYISNELTPSPTDPYATLVHGDYKAMNVFLPKDPNGDAIMIDFASTGVGLGMSDVAMHIIHAVRPPDQKGDELLDGYLESLHKKRLQFNPNAVPYPRNVALRHYRLAYVDYFRFILGRFWRSASPETFEKKKKSKNTTLVNRDADAAVAFIANTDRYLTEFELEFKSSQDAASRER